MKSKYTLIILLSISIIGIYSCKREEEVKRWDTNILTPLIHSSLSINNLVVDSLLSKNSDNSLSIVYKNSLYKASIDTLFKIPDTSATSVAKLATLVLSDHTVTYPMSLGTIFTQSGNGAYNSLNGGMWPIPAINNIKAGPFNVDAGAYFETMTLNEGSMIIKIDNQLPVDITNVIFKLSNQSDGSLIAQDTFPIIPTLQSRSDTISLNGKTINRNLLVDLINMDTPGSNGQFVKIDTSKAIIMTLTTTGLKPSSATAIFPAQNLIDTVKSITLELSPVELVQVNLRHGDIFMQANSTLQDSVYLTYGIPSATKNGVPFVKKFTLPPAPKGGNSSLNLQFDFTGYDLDMTGQFHNTVNTIYTSIVARIDSTGKIKTLALTDSIYFNVAFKNLLPNYAKGYLGNRTVNAKGEAPVKLFSKISGGTLSLQNVICSLTIENRIGIAGSLLINDITAINSRTNQSVSLTGSIIGTPQAIDKPKAPLSSSPANIIPTVDSITLDNSNSNIKKIIETMPDKLNYSLSISMNPLGNTGNTDFVYYGSNIEASLNMQIPLDLIANKLELKDTIDFAFGNSRSYDNITGGQLTLLSDNGFPFDAFVQIYLLDNSFNKTDSLISSGKIDAASLNSNNKATVKKRSKLNIPISQNKIEKLKQAKKVLIVANFSTIPANTSLKIYSDYAIDFKLVGDFKYSINR